MKVITQCKAHYVLSAFVAEQRQTFQRHCRHKMLAVFIEGSFAWKGIVQ